MRFVSILVLFLAVSLSGSAQTDTPNKLNQMEWLLGQWTRTNSRPGKSGFEHWQKLSATEWTGRGISMTGGDTTFVEKLTIKVEKEKLYYVAEVPGNAKPVYFEIVTVTPNSFVCENPQHDFPKRIAYQFDGKEIRARVSAGEQGMDYVFVRSR